MIRGVVRVHGSRVTVVQQRKGGAASEPIQPPGGQRQARRARRCRRTDARKTEEWRIAGTREWLQTSAGHNQKSSVLNLTGGFGPALGASFRILAFGSETGNF